MDHLWSSLPSQFLIQLKEIIPEQMLSSVLEGLSNERTPSFRVNTINSDVQTIKNDLAEMGFVISQMPWCHEAFVFEKHQRDELTQTDLYKEGKIYFQSLSSIVPTLVLAPNSNEEVLDLCAAPGSKTSHIAAMMDNKGAIIANDNSRSRVFRLQANLKALGVLNTRAVCIPGEWAWKKYPEMFDKVLVDVPCSMEGRFVASDKATFEDWKPSKGKILSQRQKYLLRSAIACTKPGGVIVYSTCTLNPRENEEVIDWILEKDKSVVLEEINIPGLETEHGLSGWHKKEYHKDISKTIRIYPSRMMEGFFVAKLRKLMID